jgi:serine/threonine-protein kinase
MVEIMPAEADSGDDRTVIAGPQDGATLPLGSKILNGTYVIRRLLGKGGMGEVYEADHVELDAKRAIKIILPEFAKNTKYLGLFVEEARKLSRVNNDAIVRYYEFSRDETGARYLVMEFVAGESLATVLENRRFGPADVLQLLERLAQGLSAAYEQGIKAHRDISPANVLLPGGLVDHAKLIDFGIAKSGDAGVTLIGSDFAGKFSYMSPEQAGLFGGQQEVNEKSDIYSLGLLLTAAAIGFGTRLDMGTEPASVIRARQTVPNLDLVPVELRPLLQRMLQPRPEDRPESMHALIEEARRLSKVFVASPFASVAPPLPRPRAKRPVWLYAGGGVGLMLAAGLAAFVLWPKSPEPAATPSETSQNSAPALSPSSATSPAPDGATGPIGPTAPSPVPPTSAVPASAVSPSAPQAGETPLAARLTASLPAPSSTPLSPTTSATPATEAALPVAPPPAAAPPDPHAELTAMVEGLDCATLRTANGSPPQISGTVADAADQARLLDITARLPAAERPQFHIEIVPPPVCRSLGEFEKFQQYGLVASGGVEVSVSDAGGLHEGQPIVVRVRSQRDYPLNLRIDYFTLGGEVLHMWPNADLPTAVVAPGEAREFFHSGPGNQVWQIGGAPFGAEVIAVTATALPLDFAPPRPTVEPAAGYLRDLQNALNVLHVPSGRPSFAQTELIHTSAK